jgi:APA family basic amino acid/polyamine antiporter
MGNPSGYLHRVTRLKPIHLGTAASSKADGSGLHLRRSMSTFQLTMLGVGSTVGTGIFFVLTQTVPIAGPAVILSFVIASVVAGLTALCYAEMASTIPIAGSSYSYSYVTMGEGIAMLVASCLLLEYGISISAVAVGWSGYVDETMHILTGTLLPPSLLGGPFVVHDGNVSLGGDGIINLPAMLLIWMCAFMLMRGTRESARINAIMVCIKLGVLAMFVIISFTAFTADNFTPFIPHGVSGVNAAAGMIFFTYVGLDAVSTAAEEAENPHRAMPVAIISALVIVTAVYLLVAIAGLSAQAPGKFAGEEAGLAQILQQVTGAAWPALILAIGAIVSVFSVTLVTLYGQSRILYAISRDGMMPSIFSRLSERRQTPVACTMIIAAVVSVIAGFVPADVIWDLTSMGTLVAFMVVSAGVILLRRRQPDTPRGFKVPLYPFTPVISILACLYLLTNLESVVFKLFAVWVTLWALVYLFYGCRHSRLEANTKG